MDGAHRASILRLPEHQAADGFDFTLHMQRLCRDICARLPELAHIDLTRVAVGYSQARKAVRHGIQATLTPLRFEHGALQTVRHGRVWTVQRLYHSSGTEMLYILNFYLPRFMEGPLEEKLTTVLHELWHISPCFDGDLRRHPGRCYAHSGSQKKYDEAMLVLAQRWLDLRPDEELFSFLKLSFRQLARRHGHIWGLKIPAPKLLPFSAVAQ